MSGTNTLKRQRAQTVLPFSNPRAAPAASFTIGRGMAYSKVDITSAANNTDIHASPIQIMAGTRFDRIGIHVFATVAGSIRLGIYENNPFLGVPGALLKEFGTVASTAGFQEITIDFTIHETGLYWLAFQVESAVVNLLGGYGGGLFPVRSGVAMGAVYQKTLQTAGSLANPFPASPTVLGILPRLLLRVLETPNTVTSVDRIKILTRAYPQKGSNCVFGAKLTFGSQTKVYASNDLSLIPWVVQIPSYITTINMDVSTAATAGSQGDFLLYDSKHNNTPNNILYKQTHAIDVADTITSTLNRELVPGLYWLGFHNRASGNVTMVAHDADGDLQFAVTATNYPSMGMKINTASAPDPFTGTPVDG